MKNAWVAAANPSPSHPGDEGIRRGDRLGTVNDVEKDQPMTVRLTALGGRSRRVARTCTVS